ncbi:basic leucine zipper transcriptional factor ATF-like 3 isoform X2 [Epinephelus moara]|uniref:basic leucine zipper transcriptional factor ATF-like 3 isoform X2 n=1 Tax=Epinephelus moara TaxID=300413 RepID=UPI00214EA67C|nr:basic leucine zipper transcriptional factor ATF-like 3 isoform X2 [Epinephelus moara]
MSPLFMDTGYNSPVTVSDEGSNSAGLEREEGQQMGGKGRKRQEKNRDAARKSRRKQTERADELHEFCSLEILQVTFEEASLPQTSLTHEKYESPCQQFMV